MESVKHYCFNCDAEMEFPAQVECIRCPRCSSVYAVDVYEEVVTLKRLKDGEVEPLKVWAANVKSRSKIELQSDLAAIDGEIAVRHQEMRVKRNSAASSLSVAFLFFFFAIASLLVDRAPLALFCGLITTTMMGIAGGSLKESARSRSELISLTNQRENLMKEIEPNLPHTY